MDNEQMTARLGDLITGQRDDRRVLLVGITGVDACGKSQLADALNRHLLDGGVACSLVHVDDFHRSRAERYASQLPEPQQYYERSIDFERLTSEVLKPLRRDCRLDIRLRLLDLPTDTWTLEREIHVKPGGVVVLEGVFLLRPEIRQFIDLSVFLHADEKVVLQRAHARDVPSQGSDVIRKYHEKYLPAQRAYLSANRPDQLADILIDNSQWKQPKIVRWPSPKVETP